jgi:hypothetical protein
MEISEATKKPSVLKARLGAVKRSVVHWLLRRLQYRPGTVIDQGDRKYIIDDHGAWRRIGRDW